MTGGGTPRPDPPSAAGGQAVASSPIPLEAELGERLGWFIGLRWLAGTGICASAWLAGALGLLPSARPLVVTGLAVLAYNALFAWRQGQPRSRVVPPYRLWITVQMALDWLALTSIVHYTGGIGSPVALAFVFHIVIGALLLPRQAYAHASVAAVLLATLMLVEARGLWPPVVSPLVAWSTGGPGVAHWLLLCAFFAITAVLTHSIGRTLRAKEAALDQSLHKMEALYELGQVANATLELSEVLRLIARRTTQLMAAHGCAIGLLEEGGTRVRTHASHGLSETYLGTGTVEVARSGLLSAALRGEVVYVDDVSGDVPLQYPERAHQEGIAAIAGCALSVRDRPIGVIRVYFRDHGSFDEGDALFLRNLANLAAVAIESARIYAQSQALSQERAWFARTTHHQLRAPLAVIRGLLEALPYAGDLNPKQANLVVRAARRVDESLDLVRDLLDLADAQRPTAHLQAEPVPLTQALAQTLETMNERARQRQVDLQVEGLEEAVVAAAAEDVRRIFANLLDNAIKYTPAGGHVSLRATRRAGSVEVTVGDTGIGIAAADRERVFRGFYRSPAARRTGEPGTGIGLSIVQRLVTRWHGTLRLDSTPGEGTRIAVALPAAHA